MIELKDGINYHNFNLDTKSEKWFKKLKTESIQEWLNRVSYSESSILSDWKLREKNEYWLKDSFEISLTVLTFLRENKIEQELFEDLCGFELNLKGTHDFTLSEIRKLELLTNKKLL